MLFFILNVRKRHEFISKSNKYNTIISGKYVFNFYTQVHDVSYMIQPGKSIFHDLPASKIKKKKIFDNPVLDLHKKKLFVFK